MIRFSPSLPPFSFLVAPVNPSVQNPGKNTVYKADFIQKREIVTEKKSALQCLSFPFSYCHTHKVSTRWVSGCPVDEKWFFNHFGLKTVHSSVHEDAHSFSWIKFFTRNNNQRINYCNYKFLQFSALKWVNTCTSGYIENNLKGGWGCCNKNKTIETFRFWDEGLTSFNKDNCADFRWKKSKMKLPLLKKINFGGKNANSNLSVLSFQP